MNICQIMLVKTKHLFSYSKFNDNCMTEVILPM